jgi:hypothetical protein
MVLLILGRQSSLTSSSYLPHLYGRIGSFSLFRIGISSVDREAVVTRSLSEAKDVSRMVPPCASTYTKDEARLLVSGPDATGIVASFSQLLFAHGCGIVDCASESSEVGDNNGNKTHRGRQFFQRIVFDCSQLKVERSVLASDIEATCRIFGMKCHLVSLCSWRGHVFLTLSTLPMHDLPPFNETSRGEIRDQKLRYSSVNMITVYGSFSYDIVLAK